MIKPASRYRNSQFGSPHFSDSYESPQRDHPGADASIGLVIVQHILKSFGFL